MRDTVSINTPWRLPSFFLFFLYYFMIQLALGQSAVGEALSPMIARHWWSILVSPCLLLIALTLLMPDLLRRDGLRVEDVTGRWTMTGRALAIGIAGGSFIHLFKTFYRDAVRPFTDGAVVNTALTRIFRSMGTGPLNSAGFALSVAVLYPVIEELVFSAYAINSMEKVWGKMPLRTAVYVAISSVLFCAMHSTGHPLYSIGYLFSGILFRLVYVFSRSLPTAFLTHSFVNVLADLI
jgi:membrane protease YdiL (CAAX protease family)